MVQITATAILDGKPAKSEHEVEMADSGFCVIVHQQNLKVDVPSFVEINPQDTIRVMEELSEAQWKWISKGEIFKRLWACAFLGDPKYRGGKDEDACPEIPEHVFVLNMGDYGLRHVAGMIVLGCEACQQGKSVFYRNPETYLHPKVERLIMYMFRDMLSLYNRSGEVQVAEDGELQPLEEQPPEFINELPVPDDDDEEIEVVEIVQEGNAPDSDGDMPHCVEWLETLKEHYDGDKVIAQMDDGERLTVDQLLDHVAKNSPIGEWFIKEFVKLRDG